MAGRILNRRELRKQADDAEARESQQDSEVADEDEEVDDADEDDGDEDDGDEDEGSEADAEDELDDEAPRPAKKKPAKAKARPVKARQPRKPKAVPRMRARWGVFDASMKQVAVFDYNQRAAADAKAAELAAKKNGTFFLQLVKEPMPDAAPADAPAPKAK
jgi:hypothetical protein